MTRLLDFRFAEDAPKSKDDVIRHMIAHGECNGFRAVEQWREWGDDNIDFTHFIRAEFRLTHVASGLVFDRAIRVAKMSHRISQADPAALLSFLMDGYREQSFTFRGPDGLVWNVIGYPHKPLVSVQRAEPQEKMQPVAIPI